MRLPAAIALFCFQFLLFSHNDLVLADNHIKFAVLGDWGADLDDAPTFSTQKAVAQAMIENLPQVLPNIDFILAPGDNFYPAGLSNNSADNLNRLHQNFIQMYPSTLPAFNVPWYFNVGNHDYDGVVNSQINLTSIDWRWNLPSRYYYQPLSNRAGNLTLDLFIIDTNPSGIYYGNQTESPQMTKELATQNYTSQLIWLESMLSSHHGDYCLVSGHHTIYADKASHSFVELQTTISPLLEKYGCFYISGHQHDLEHNSNNKIDYFISGAACQTPITQSIQDHHVELENNNNKVNDNSIVNAGKKSKNLFVDVEAGYMTVEISQKHMDVNFYNYKNKNVYSVSIDKYDRP